jgi:hypothetical protein
MKLVAIQGLPVRLEKKKTPQLKTAWLGGFQPKLETS